MPQLNKQSRFQFNRHTRAMRDRIFNQPIGQVRAWTFQFLSRTQIKPEALLVSCACLLVMLCRHMGIRPLEVVDMADKIITDSLEFNGDPNGHMRASMAYIAGEIEA